MSEKVTIFDTTLRDGEQSAGVAFSERDKLDIAERLQALKVDVIEAGFPAASLSELKAVRAVAQKAIKRKTGARGLRAILEGVMLDVMYEIPSSDNVKRVAIDENVILDNVQPLMVFEESSSEPEDRKLRIS